MVSNDTGVSTGDPRGCETESAGDGRKGLARVVNAPEAAVMRPQNGLEMRQVRSGVHEVLKRIGISRPCCNEGHGQLVRCGPGC